MSANRVVRFLFGLLIITVAGACGPGRSTPSEANRPLRVISLAPNVTELICAIGAGDLLVGRTSACDYPLDAVSNVPVIGGFGDPSLELLVQAQPTLVVAADMADKSMAAKIESFGIRFVQIPCARIEEIPAAMEELGRLLDRASIARQAAERLRAQLKRLEAASAPLTNRPSVFVEIWSDPLTTAGRSSYLSELVRLSGGMNAGDDVEKPYFQTSSEWVIRRNPDIILCFRMGGEGAGCDAVSKRPGWKQIRAVKTGRVYDHLNPDVMLRPGPRVAEAIATLQDILLPLQKANGAPQTDAGASPP